MRTEREKGMKNPEASSRSVYSRTKTIAKQQNKTITEK